jgi:biopolymer transport protein ExbB/TolQ/ABC-type transporter Mla subunit MlaD
MKPDQAPNQNQFQNVYPTQRNSGFNAITLLSGRPGTTDVSLFITGLLGLLLSMIFYTIFPLPQLRGSYFYEVFAERGNIPYAIAFLFFWTAAILIFKAVKVWQQKSAFRFEIIPSNMATINLQNVDQIKENIIRLFRNPREKIVANRIWTALEHYSSVEMEENVGDILRYQAEIDAGIMDSSYNISKTFIWAIPILGFIGTVLGIGSAVGGFSKFTQAALEIDQIKTALDVITSGLSVAFDTTLAGLVGSLILMLPSTALQNTEEKFLAEVENYCIDNMLNKLEGTRGEAGITKTAITSESEALKFKRIIEETFQQHLNMLKECFQAWSGGFSGVMEQVNDQTRLVGEQFAAIQPLTATFKQNMETFTTKLSSIAGQQTEMLGSLKDQLKNLQPLISNMSEISNSLTQERKQFQEQGIQWIENLEKMGNNILLKFDDKFSQQLDSLNEIGKGLQTQRQEFHERLSHWTKGFEDLSQQVSSSFEQQLGKLSQVSGAFEGMMEKETQIMEFLNQNIEQLTSSETNMKEVLAQFTNVLQQEKEIINQVNRNFEQLSMSDTMFKDTLAGIRTGLESLKPPLEQLARPKKVRLIEE